MRRSVSVEMFVQEGVILRLHCRLFIAAAVRRRLCESQHPAWRRRLTVDVGSSAMAVIWVL